MRRGEPKSKVSGPLHIRRGCDEICAGEPVQPQSRQRYRV